MSLGIREIALLHLSVVPILFGTLIYKKNTLPKPVYKGVIALAVGIAGYHLYKATQREVGEFRQLVNIFHILVIAGILMHVGYEEGNVKDYIWAVMLALLAAAAAYHGDRLITYPVAGKV